LFCKTEVIHIELGTTCGIETYRWVFGGEFNTELISTEETRIGVGKMSHGYKEKIKSERKSSQRVPWWQHKQYGPSGA
jgi:hypothetical protein